MPRPAPVLLIGGIDSGAGAGLLRDAETVRDLGLAARVAVTAVTAQTDRRVSAIHPVPAGTVVAQIAAATASGPIGAVKIGMLCNAGIVRAVAENLPDVPVVLDPVLAASSGAALLDEAGLAVLLRDLVPRVALVTPNLPEAARLASALGRPTAASPAEQAAELLARGAKAVLIKGGHGEGRQSRDLLFAGDGPAVELIAPRREGTARGTGCTLASAVACGLSMGMPLESACRQAKAKALALFERG